jgi:hypothetical protein
MDRREVLNLGGLAALAGALSPFASVGGERMQSAPAITRETKLLRIYEDAQGNSHLEDLVIAVKPAGLRADSLNVPVTEMFVREYTPNAVLDWHTSAARQFGITIVGELEVEVSGGVRRRVRKGDLVFLEDTKGKGHITRLQGLVTNLFIKVPNTFDVVEWSRGKP